MRRVAVTAEVAIITIAATAEVRPIVVTTIGLTSAVAAIVVIATSAVTATRRIDAFDDVRAEAIERDIARLVAAGANEETVRGLVREAIELGRSAT